MVPSTQKYLLNFNNFKVTINLRLMKRAMKTFCTIARFLCFNSRAKTGHTDGPPPPPPGGPHGGGGNAPPGGGVPIGEGTLLLLIMAVGYSTRRIAFIVKKTHNSKIA